MKSSNVHVFKSKALALSGVRQFATAPAVQSPYSYSVGTMTLVLQRLGDISEKLQALTDRVQALESGAPGPLRDLSDAEAREEIRAYFSAHDGEVIYPSDVAEDLSLGYDFVARLIGELEADGKISKA